MKLAIVLFVVAAIAADVQGSYIHHDSSSSSAGDDMNEDSSHSSSGDHMHEDSSHSSSGDHMHEGSSHSSSGDHSSFSYSRSDSSSSWSSLSWSHSFSNSHEHGFGHPKCCNPCEMLKNKDTQFYKKCGQYLDADVMASLLEECYSSINDLDAIYDLMETIRQKCYTDFAVIVHMSCPPMDIPKLEWGNCDADVFNAWKESCYGDYCPEPYEKCNKCQALIEENSHFYEVCGHAIDEKLRQVWYRKCLASGGYCDWKVLFAEITAYCHCHNPDEIPDFCRQATQTTTTTSTSTTSTTTTTTTTTTPSKDCIMADGSILPFVSPDTVMNDCTKICNCTTPGVALCQNIACHVNATCEDNTCVCIPPNEGDGYRCFPPAIEECKGQDIDLVFVVDVSQSISSIDFKKMIQFLNNVVIQLDINENSTHVGIIRFSMTAVNEAVLGENDKAGLVDIIAKIVHEKGLTYTDKAIYNLIEMMDDNGRESARKVVIIVTDGRSTNQRATALAMEKFRQRYPDSVVVVVGVLNSGDVDEGELRMMATGTMDKNVLSVEDFNVLLQRVQEVALDACKEQTTMQPEVEEGKPVPDCRSLNFHGPDSDDRWMNYYGTYDIILGQGLCNEEFVYVHVDHYHFLQWNDVEETWEISSKPCVFDEEHVQAVARLVYGVAGSTHVITEPGDIWNEPPWNPTYKKAFIVCYP